MRELVDLLRKFLLKWESVVNFIVITIVVNVIVEQTTSKKGRSYYLSRKLSLHLQKLSKIIDQITIICQISFEDLEMDWQLNIVFLHIRLLYSEKLVLLYSFSFSQLCYYSKVDYYFKYHYYSTYSSEEHLLTKLHPSNKCYPFLNQVNLDQRETMDYHCLYYNYRYYYWYYQLEFSGHFSISIMITQVQTNWEE